ncbi:hypothetical protein D7X94_12930 [Acutalibacter sp. 1XD8-33]|uniref:hypothetical protein n=1 Tax=Acutalibacter sp. 1XD8-33 TaxID=2320081 RepID=UPI000EA1ED3B|nr:hypothetical protein [Acutalibacter sp. 1XD8-33]RKJ39335.1 hypothetical protein D7X94_12930 [Acutalibacter sp. 1XD8-33]
MAKGSVCRKRDRKNDTITGEDGKPRQIERAGTESKAETERMMRKAMDDYENRLFVTQASNLTLAEAIDMWIEEGLKPSFLANGAVHQFDQGQQKQADCCGGIPLTFGFYTNERHFQKRSRPIPGRLLFCISQCRVFL